jgi:uncharacterized membrane protein HdeD (DUF308 family)
MAQNNLPAAKNLKWLGIVLIVFGVIAIVTPAVAGSAVVIVIGSIMLVAGAVQIMRGLRAEGWTEKALASVLGVITVVAGVMVIGHPLLGLGFLTLLLLGYFISEGVWKIIASFRYRPATGWVWLLVSGVLSLLLALLIWNQWPVSGLWAVGVMVGLNLLGTGVALVTLASTVSAVADRIDSSATGARR